MPSTPKSLPPNCQTCPVCGVSIDNEGKVHFNAGPAGSRERLYARVCRFAASAGCINEGDRQITDADNYGKAGFGISLPPSVPFEIDRRAA